MQPNHCHRCRWWRKINSAVGECRRMPPHPLDAQVDARLWPFTNRNDWCGEFAEVKKV